MQRDQILAVKWIQAFSQYLRKVWNRNEAVSVQHRFLEWKFHKIRFMFAGMVQSYTDKTMTSLTSNAVVAYPLLVLLLGLTHKCFDSILTMGTRLFRSSSYQQLTLFETMESKYWTSFLNHKINWMIYSKHIRETSESTPWLSKTVGSKKVKNWMSVYHF